MSDIANPWQTPDAQSVPETPAAARHTLTDTMLHYLKQASPWLTFIGILGFISCGFLVLFAIIFFAAGSLLSAAFSELDTVGVFGNYLGTFFGGMMGFYFLVFAVIGFFPSFFIFNFGQKISSYMRTGAEQDLELAFKNNKSLWKFIGILAIIQLAFIPLTIILGIIAVIFGTLSQL